MARLSRFIESLHEGTLASLGNYRKLKTRWPLAGKYYDVRTWLMLELASHAENTTLRFRLRDDLGYFLKYQATAPERRVLSRISRNLFY